MGIALQSQVKTGCLIPLGGPQGSYHLELFGHERQHGVIKSTRYLLEYLS